MPASLCGLVSQLVPQMVPQTFGSLFTGVGSLDLGLERAGMRCLWACEIDPKARAVLRRHWPDVQLFEDIRLLKGADLPAVDLIAGGFPCQPHSLSGKRLASADERDLWSEMLRVIDECGPDWVLGENVVGLRSSENGAFYGRILRELAARRMDAQWDCLPASAVGADHPRDRLFLVAYSDRIRRHLADPVFADHPPAPAPEWTSAEPGGTPVINGRAYRALPAYLGIPDGDAGRVDGDRGAESCASRTCANSAIGPAAAAGRSPWYDLSREERSAISARLKQCGNAVAAPVAEHVGRRLLDAAKEAALAAAALEAAA